MEEFASRNENARNLEKSFGAVAPPDPESIPSDYLPGIQERDWVIDALKGQRFSEVPLQTLEKLSLLPFYLSDRAFAYYIGSVAMWANSHPKGSAVELLLESLDPQLTINKEGFLGLDRARLRSLLGVLEAINASALESGDEIVSQRAESRIESINARLLELQRAT